MIVSEKKRVAIPMPPKQEKGAPERKNENYGREIKHSENLYEDRGQRSRHTDVTIDVKPPEKK